MRRGFSRGPHSSRHLPEEPEGEPRNVEVVIGLGVHGDMDQHQHGGEVGEAMHTLPVALEDFLRKTVGGHRQQRPESKRGESEVDERLVNVLQSVGEDVPESMQNPVAVKRQPNGPLEPVGVGAQSVSDWREAETQYHQQKRGKTSAVKQGCNGIGGLQSGVGDHHLRQEQQQVHQPRTLQGFGHKGL